METIDNLNFQENASTQELTINTAIRSYLQNGAKWGKFLSITGFIFIGLMTIAAFSMGAIMSSLGNVGGPFAAMGTMGGGVITFIYLLLALFYFFPTFYLFQFSNKTLKSLKNKALF